MLGTAILGDMNVHNQRWLHYSSETSAEGRFLEAKCREHGLDQIIREPTRNDNLLNLILTDITGAKPRVLPGIADHK